MKNHIPVIGDILSSVPSYLFIHFWFAEYYASMTGVSYDSAYIGQVMLLVLFTAFRAWRTARGKDELANWTERRLDKSIHSKRTANSGGASKRRDADVD